MAADPPPSPVPRDARPDGGLAERLPPLVEAAHRVWASPQERRRMRAFGFIPAVEPGVLKRDWHGFQVRVSPELLTFGGRGGAVLSSRVDDPVLRLGDDPFAPTTQGTALAEGLVALIQAYERWVEAREGREGRLRRGHWSSRDRRPLNALAETRRVQRLLHGGARRPARPR